MSSNGKVQRLLQILEYLQSGRKHHTGELAGFLGVSKRTVFRDLKVLQDSGVQLLYDQKEQGYWIPATTIIPPTEMTYNETLSLLLMGNVVGNAEHGIPFQSAGRHAALKMLSNLPASIGKRISCLMDHVHFQMGQMNAQHQGQGQEHYERVLQAIGERRKIRLEYDCPSCQNPVTTLVSPYSVLYRDHFWYVIGRSSLHRNTQAFHIIRIQKSVLTSDVYEIPPRYSIKRHFGNAWRMIREKPKVEVVVRFNPESARCVSEGIWHPTQQMVWNADGSLTFHVNVEGIREISSWILGFGEQAEVLSPQSLRELIMAHVSKMMGTYGSPIV
jgi:predicted DNA-binding transcriptional regulator YafY